jgi:hypothetical protein
MTHAIANIAGLVLLIGALLAITFAPRARRKVARIPRRGHGS